MIARTVSTLGIVAFLVAPSVAAEDPLEKIKDLMRRCVGPAIFDYKVVITEPHPILPDSGGAENDESGDFGEFYYIGPLYGGKHLYSMDGYTAFGACYDEPERFTGMVSGKPQIYNPILCQSTSVCDPHD